MNMEVVGSEEPMRLLSDMVNRLTMALIVVGLFVGSSIVYYAGMKPIIFGIPVVGFMGYVIAFILPHGSCSTSTSRTQIKAPVVLDGMICAPRSGRSSGRAVLRAGQFSRNSCGAFMKLLAQCSRRSNRSCRRARA